MKTFNITFLFALILASTVSAFAQKKTETIPVSGNCGMCESTIEKAAKNAGALSADWNKDTKMLAVTYEQGKTSSQKIQQAIADAGYDTKDVRANNAVYEKLPACCHYDRTAATAKQEKCGASCDKDSKACSDKEKCGKNGCTEGAANCCKQGNEAKMDCCKGGACTRHS